MSNHDGSRKRLKVSRTEGKPTSTIMAPEASASASTLGNNKTVNGHTSPSDAACHHEQALKTLHTDLDAMRQLVTCKICHRLLYEPYSLSCGHTYCYSCLSQWLVDTHKKTCPDCRAKVEQQPTPSYVIRELVLVFVSRNELLPDGETSEEHHTYVKDEADIVARDRGNADQRTGGLFKGLFKLNRRPWMIRPIHDASDGVDRCPHCNWELEEGFCNQCGEDIDLDFSDYGDDSDLSDGDLDHELDAEDARAVWGADGQDDFLGGDDLIWLDESSPVNEPGLNAIGGPPAHRRTLNGLPQRQAFGGARPTIDIRSSDDEESDEEDESGENLTGFIVDDDDDDATNANSDDSDHTEVDASAAANRPLGRRRALVVVSDDEDEDGPPSVAPPESDPESDDDGPIARGSQRNRRGRLQTRQPRARTISSEEESSGDEADRFGSETGATGGFSPLDSTAEDALSMRSGYDSESVVSSVHPMYGDMYGEEDDDDTDESDNDDGWGMQAETPLHLRQPPSTSSHRLQHLGQHSNRHASVLARALAPSDPSPTMPTRSGRLTRPRESFPTYPAATGYSQIHPPRFFAGQSSPWDQPSNIDRAGRRPPPPHPFQLGSTLDNVNRRAANANRNYNQRNQQIRSNQGARNVSGTSSQSSNGGGVNVNSSGSSGSSTTIGHATSGRRKRVLSISSDASAEDGRRVYH